MLMDTAYPNPFPPPWAAAWGDDRYGLWATFEVKGVVQRLRWIAPGSFQMGSDPMLDVHHQPNETQHWVTLNQGYWLADTPCTQALWQVVIGSNPSYVKDDPEKPVDSVNWDKVQDFFGALAAQGFLPAGFEACLPSEAQWEYACRAGSALAYHFGDTVSTDWCNHDYGRNASLRHQTKQTTLSVKVLWANAWGLYQMHGNVWEWCADGKRIYTANAVSDPEGSKGADKDDQFAVRGGSWGHSGRGTRSAGRDAYVRARYSNALGFRFLLRSWLQGRGGQG